MSDWQCGKFFLVGGGPAARRLGEPFMQRFICEAGGDAARIAIITAGSEIPELANADYWDSFTAFGVTNLFSPKIFCRDHAMDEDMAASIAASTAVFIAGGSQEKLMQRLAATPVEAAMKTVLHNGGLVGGTSAGASLWGSQMILDGGAENKHLRPDMIEIGCGLDWFPQTAIDTHCSSRGRLPRNLALLHAHHDVQVIGMDEDTAMLIDENGIAEILGYHAVYALDARTSSLSRPQHDPNEIRFGGVSGLVMHCLVSGDRYDLKNRERL